MLLGALADALTYPPLLAIMSLLPSREEVGFEGVGSSILKKMGGSALNNGHDMSMFLSNARDVDMSFV